MADAVMTVDTEASDACGVVGPRDRVCSRGQGHESLHEGSDDKGTSFWDDAWKPNPHRTTWRSDS